MKNRKLPDADDLLEVTDLLIDGPFIATEKDFSRPWVGSSNQQFHFLSKRYRHLEKQLARFTNGLEIRLMPNGGIFINGMMEKEMLDVLKARL
jgi:anaerobic ribonucleoside-triphosphate reductase activating protein